MRDKINQNNNDYREKTLACKFPLMQGLKLKALFIELKYGKNVSLSISFYASQFKAVLSTPCDYHVISS